MTPADMLADARDMAMAAAGEARVRAAISRAYYAALHHALTEATKAGFRDPRNRSVHRTVVEFLAGHDAEWAVTAARNLSRLRAERERADYKLALIIPADAASHAMVRADAVFSSRPSGA